MDNTSKTHTQKHIKENSERKALEKNCEATNGTDREDYPSRQSDDPTMKRTCRCKRLIQLLTSPRRFSVPRGTWRAAVTRNHAARRGGLSRRDAMLPCSTIKTGRGTTESVMVLPPFVPKLAFLSARRCGMFFSSKCRWNSYVATPLATSRVACV